MDHDGDEIWFGYSSIGYSDLAAPELGLLVKCHTGAQLCWSALLAGASNSSTCSLCQSGTYLTGSGRLWFEAQICWGLIDWFQRQITVTGWIVMISNDLSTSKIRCSSLDKRECKSQVKKSTIAHSLASKSLLVVQMIIILISVGTSLICLHKLIATTIV
jgi:hypothetical protein